MTLTPKQRKKAERDIEKWSARRREVEKQRKALLPKWRQALQAKARLDTKLDALDAELFRLGDDIKLTSQQLADYIELTTP